MAGTDSLHPHTEKVIPSSKAALARKKFTSSSIKPAPSKLSSIPLEILENKNLNNALAAVLPTNYNFEIHKTIHQLRINNVKKTALQLPEGLLMYSLVISDLLEAFVEGLECVVMGDVTYGACCVDDFTAKAIGCDFLVHYGHSCLVSVMITQIKTLYVFVDIKLNLDRFVKCIQAHFEPGSRIAIVATIQFVTSLQEAVGLLEGFDLVVPQARPLSRGEILGCTAPKFVERDYIIYLGDGRFHLEAIMISNPTIAAFRYDPYTNKITRERYDHTQMQMLRTNAIEISKRATTFGLIVGTLGRQGNKKVIEYLSDLLKSNGKKFITILVSEITPHKLDMFRNVDAWIQVSCPRLSIDWGYAFTKPLITPYEAAVVFGSVRKWDDVEFDKNGEEMSKDYPMDFYASGSLGPWTPNHIPKKIQL